MKIELSQSSPSASEAQIRRHTIPIDRPAAKGGADAGPMGGELFLAAIAGCFMSNLLAAIAARNAPISGVRIEVTATLAEAPARFESVALLVHAEHPDPAELHHLIDIADRGCIMMNTLRGKLPLTVSFAPRYHRTIE
jgi:putative redox protein